MQQENIEVITTRGRTMMPSGLSRVSFLQLLCYVNQVLIHIGQDN
jgi:hypothetical protein